MRENEKTACNLELFRAIDHHGLGLAGWATSWGSKLVHGIEERDVEIKRLKKRCKAQDDLLVCYRIGKHPSERILRDLDETREVGQ